jgi:hypothetical protein
MKISLKELKKLIENIIKENSETTEYYIGPFLSITNIDDAIKKIREKYTKLETTDPLVSDKIEWVV